MESRDIQRFCEKNNIGLLVVFGSFASEKMNPASDVDIAVNIKNGTMISKLELIYKLNDLFEGKDIDLVILTKDTDPLLLYEIFLHGKLLYEKTAGIFEAEKLRAWKLYIDTKKLRRLQKTYIKKFIEKTYSVA